MNWMIYGANGYTGELIAREAVKRGQKPVLAGRNADKLAALAKELQLEVRAFGLDDAAQLSNGLQGIELVLHCAGPFSATRAPRTEACLQDKEHYPALPGAISGLNTP